MNRESLPLTDIKVPERFRRDYGDLTLLKDSIKQYGLIQPIVITQDRTLIAGGRRYTAHMELGLPTIDIVYKETLTEAERQECEAIENIVRKSFTWTEEAIAIRRIHNTRRINSMLGDGEWNTRLACELFGISKGALDYVLQVAFKLEEELKLPEDQRPYHQYNSCSEAYRLGILGEIEKQGLALLAAKHKKLAESVPAAPAAVAQQAAVVAEVAKAEASPDALADLKEKYYSNPLNAPNSFESYWKSRQEQKREYENTIPLSSRLFHGSCVAYMNERPAVFHHIITDIPYGIDMDMLNQQNPHGGLTDLDRVEESHQVEENMDLMNQFFPAAFKCTKEKAFLITYCDVMQWQYMYDIAVGAGWNVQRWPIVWHKQSGGMNQCAQYNTTKNYDIIMVCRKPGSTLVKPLTSSIILASHEAAKTDCKHPFSKPYDVTRILAECISIKGDTFLEPFAGGGSIAIELTRQERNVIACEKDEHHYNLLVENYKQFYLKLNPATVFK